MILEEFDKNKKSTFDPTDVEEPVTGFPKIGISCFSYDLLNRLVELFNGKEIAKVSNANCKNPIYEIDYHGNKYALFVSFVGAPTCVVEYEELFAMGLEKVVVFGTCGVLDKNIADLAIIIPTSAVRDEGTSYHYLEASDEIITNPKYKDEFKDLLKKHNYSYVEGKTWTTDAPYRETKAKVMKRKDDGCICVEMECASLAALAKFRDKDIFQFFYAADNLDGEKWDERSLSSKVKVSEKESVGLLGIELAEKINVRTK